MLIECRDKNHCRQPLRAERAQHFKAIHPGHLHIEQQQVGRVLSRGLHRGGTISALRHDLHIRLAPEQAAEPIAGERLVIDDEDAQRLFHAVAAV